MTNGASRNVVGKSYIVRKKRRNLLENKENICDLTALNKHKKNVVEYLYVDPSFITDATCCYDCNRQEGGYAQKEVFYDCYSFECEDDLPGILKQQLQMFEVIDEINNAKQFKGLLKQMAFTSNFLYRTFKQAYRKTKKCNQKHARKCGTKYTECRDQLDRGDMNQMKEINVDVPHSKQDILGAVNCGSTKSMRQEKCHNDKTSDRGQKYSCISCAKLCSQGKEKICPKCFGIIEEETVICCEKYPMKPNEENENCPDLKNTNICDQYDEELKHLNFCDRCAVLRNEITLPTRKEQEPHVTKSLSKTCQDVGSVKSDANTQTQQPSKETMALNKKQVLNLNPICVTIPLKLQIDGQNCQSRFIETEIVMETFGGQAKTCIQQPQYKQKSNLLVSKSSESKSARLQKKSDSETFHSCISDSGIINPIEAPNSCHEKAFKEIYEMIKKRMPCSKDTDLPTTSINVENERKGILTNKEQVLPEATSTDPKVKAKKLRTELLDEVKVALAQTTTLLALKSLQELPKQISSVIPPGLNIPSGCQYIPLRPPEFILPLSSKGDSIIKPEIAPKPVHIRSAQTDVSSIKPTAHYKRNNLRNELLEELRELIKPNSSKEERDQILIDLHKLFHPVRAGLLPKERCYETAVQDIRYILEPDVLKTNTQTPEESESSDNILESLKYILNPRSGQKPRKKKYTKDSKDKILENLQIILIPQKQGAPSNLEPRTNILQDLRFMLTTGVYSESPVKSPRSGLQHVSDPSPTSTQLVRQESQRIATNQLKENLKADLIHLLDTNNSPQSNSNDNVVERNNAPNEPPNTTKRRSL